MIDIISEKDGKIFETLKCDDEGVLQGTLRRYDEDGHVVFTEFYVDGVRQEEYASTRHRMD